MKINKCLIQAALAPLFFMLSTGIGAAADDGRLRVVMLGDSLTFGGNWASALPEYHMINLGVSGDTTRNILARLDQVTQAAPNMIFLQAGVNDLAGGRGPEQIMEGHRRIWHKLAETLPSAQLSVISLFPVDGTRYLGFNGKIKEVNRQMQKMAKEEGLLFIDLYPALTDQDGNLRPDFTFDGLHLQASAYGQWVAAIRPALANAALDH